MTNKARPLRSHITNITTRRFAALIFLVFLLAASALAQDATEGKTPKGFEPGAPAGSYSLGGFDTVNFFNGNLNFSLPLLQIGGRGTASHTLQLKIERKWTMFEGPHSRFYARDGGWQNIQAGYGAGSLEGRTAGLPDFCEGAGDYTTLLRLTFSAPDGTEYELRDALTNGAEGLTTINSDCGVLSSAPRGRVFKTSDGAAATFISDVDIADANGEGGTPSGYMLMRDGTRFRVETGKVVWVRDRNGNLTTFAYNTNNQVTAVTDSLGRTTTISYRSGTQTYDQITYAGFGGAARTIRVHYEALEARLRSGYVKKYYRELFPELNGTSTTSHFNPEVVSSAELPDGRRYWFRYNSYGELARVELPTGGAFEYDWEAGLAGGVASGVMTTNGSHIYRRVVERRVYPEGATGNSYASRMSISKPETAGGGNTGAVAVEQWDSAGARLTKDVHYYYGSARDSFDSDPLGYAKWKDSKEWKTETFDTNGTTLLRRVEHTWQQPVAGSTWPLTTAETNDAAKANDPQTTETVTTLADSGQRTKQVFAFDRYSNRTDVYEFDYGTGTPDSLPLVRRSQTSYLTNANGADYASPNPSATSIHIRSLPQHQRVYSINPANGAQTLVAHTEMLYDESGLTPWYGTVTGWANPGTGRGNATRTRRWLDIPSSTYLETHAEYDQVGNITKTVDARGQSSFVAYSSGYHYAYPTSTTSPVPDPTGVFGSNTALVTANIYDLSTGLVTSTTDANNQTTTLEYDPNDELDRLKAIHRPAGGGSTDYEYGDESGNLYLRTLTDLDATRRMEAYQRFDKMGRAVRAATYDGTTSSPWSIVDTEYDSMGRAYRVSNAYRAATSNHGATPSTAVWTTQQFDALGRGRTVTTPDGAQVVTNYFGSKAMVTDQTGRSRRSDTDALGRLREVVEYNRTFTNPTTVVEPDANDYHTFYEYDAQGNLRRVNQGGQIRFYAYDSLSRLVRAKNPEQGVLAADENFSALSDNGNSQWSIGYAYDANGNLLKRKDARGVTTVYAYDALNRNTTVRYFDAVLGAEHHTKDIDRIYDGAINGRGRFHANWTRNATSGVYDTHLAVDEYDASGRPLYQRQYLYTNNQAGAPFTTTRAYDRAGNVTQQTYPSGHAVSYRYDAAGRLADHPANGEAAFRGTLGDGTLRAYASEIRYDADNRREQERFGTQTPVYNKSFYNVRGQLSEIRVSTHSRLAPGDLSTNWNRGAIINHYSLQSWAGSGADNNGNLRKQDVYIPDNEQFSSHSLTTQHYDYDALNRLDKTREDRNGATQWVQDYQYDRWGNRTINAAMTWGGVHAPQFDPVETTTNRLYAPGDSGRAPEQKLMRYDAAGNLNYDSYTGTGARAFDAEGRMTSATDTSGQTARYGYDADGKRVRRNTGGQEVWQVYGIDGELLAEYASGASPASPQKEYAYRAGELLVTASSTAASSSNLSISNSGFEAPALGAGNFQYGPAAASWTFAQNSGVSANASGFTDGNPSAPAGSQVAFIQTTGTITQSIDGFQTGQTYVVQFAAAQRGNWNHGGQDFEVFIDNTSLGVFRPSGTGYAEMTTNSFNVTAGAHTLKFVGKNSSGGDNTAFLDNVRITTTASQGGGGAATYSATGDFSAAQNPSAVWSYGLRTSGGAGSFTPYTSNTNVFGAGTDAWSQGGCCPLVVRNKTGATHTYPNAPSVVQPADVLNLHPGPNGEQSVVRWTAPTAGTYSITGRFEGIDNAWTTTDVSIVHNGATVLHSGQVNGYGNQSAFSLTRTVAAGDTIEFRVGVGSNNTYYQDSTGLAASITEQVAAATVANIQWMVNDQLGTPRMVIDQTGNLNGVKRHDYLPFGEEIGAGTGGRTTSQGYSQLDGVRFRFTGYERDEETGLDFAQARYYGSTMGRFTSVDPYNPIVDSEKEEEFREYLGQPQNWNRYVYVWNNPLRYIDPAGEKVYVVMYTTGNGKGDAEFKRVAETHANDIRNSQGFNAKKDTVLLMGVSSKKDVQNVLNVANSMEYGDKGAPGFGKIAQVAIVSHAGYDGPIFPGEPRSTNQWSRQELANLKVNWDRADSNTNAYFMGCGTAATHPTDKRNFAQTFADAQGVTGVGFPTGTTFSSNPTYKSNYSYMIFNTPLYMLTIPPNRGIVRRQPRR